MGLHRRLEMAQGVVLCHMIVANALDVNGAHLK